MFSGNNLHGRKRGRFVMSPFKPFFGIPSPSSFVCDNEPNFIFQSSQKQKETLERIVQQCKCLVTS